MISPKDAFRKVYFAWFSGTTPELATYLSKNSIKCLKNFMPKPQKIYHSINRFKISSSSLISGAIIRSISKSLLKFLETVTLPTSSWAQPLPHPTKSSPSLRMTKKTICQREKNQYLGLGIPRLISSLCSWLEEIGVISKSRYNRATRKS